MPIDCAGINSFWVGDRLPARFTKESKSDSRKGGREGCGNRKSLLR